MAVQQRRVSKSRKGMRRSHDHLTVSNTVACNECGKALLPHRACRDCKTYRSIKLSIK
ncbi:50S ribosomal protein L32 [Ureaplasma urealyticum]|uniref:Large ribosomal subunit protein bL32 n=3 Tax=Ureaplasma urealyticum TaxID=2130 RepID=RL32_UREU1|nr:50S ribosomal protein L32 [Ureaplasma urealyticum]B5ZBE3.1 RecName: Full=Large ribosomal subunit protein bL32; AltName: Full=50S ribosomal protein L32 [Ureaplasma urealyticum serovar 10 str. ATCC 33699]EDX53894.1 ribosomal protein L32 [Ureaplasma urealyticum serovar 9 str. ATCC 33175]RCT49420.1 50S ribosomal protein L32 [Ureaplasma parvum]ACI59996.1 ribosomal protein L32 [Ureaplasma urealyticum serovar 10 str. ATCC 33699]EDT49300.1 ribosomal protein L32 [Ureaplasma urealyticum serovar 13 st